jgi:stearoyl-CoA desaturase (delta-9 desaturase)
MDFFAGIFALPWWGYALVALALTHVTIVAVTVYLHRAQAHRALVIGQKLSHFFRCWLWLTTGMVTKEWVAIHRKHHARCEMDGDPHSPIVWLHDVHGRWKRALYMCWWIVWRGVRKYVVESHVKETIEKHGAGTPDDWMERNLYTRYSKYGIVVMLTLDILLFGIVPGVSIWVVQIIWIPIFAAGIINGLGHYVGYRNFESCHRKTKVVDSSRNIFPWGILIGGEELHNNHHAHELSAKLSAKWYEFDIGWLYIRMFQMCGMIVSIRKDTALPL